MTFNTMPVCQLKHLTAPKLCSPHLRKHCPISSTRSWGKCCPLSKATMEEFRPEAVKLVAKRTADYRGSSVQSAFCFLPCFDLPSHCSIQLRRRHSQLSPASATGLGAEVGHSYGSFGYYLALPFL